jgi:hypothetical protein
MKKNHYLNRKIDYKVFYIIGILWLFLGIIFTISAISARIFFFSLGLVFLSFSLANRDKWKGSKPLTKSQKKLSIVGSIFFVVILVLYLLSYLYLD